VCVCVSAKMCVCIVDICMDLCICVNIPNVVLTISVYKYRMYI